MGVALLFLGDDGPDVADEESHGPEGVADIPGEGCWGSWVLSWFCLVGSARAGAWALFPVSWGSYWPV